MEGGFAEVVLEILPQSRLEEGKRIVHEVIIPEEGAEGKLCIYWGR